MNISYDYFGKPEKPLLVLQMADGTNVGTLGFAYNIKYNLKYNDISQISFEYPYKVNGEISPYYDLIRGKRIIYIPNIGKFILDKPKTKRDGIKELKECVAYSLENQLNNKNITNFSGTFELYNTITPSNSLLGILISNYIPSWNIGSVDSSLIGVFRTFSISNQTLYNFIQTDMAKAYECVFSFDTLTKTINVKSLYNLSNDIGVYLSFDNLLEDIEIEEQTDQLVTALSLYGGNDLDILTVNPLGTNTVYNFDYFMNTNDMSQALINKINAWKALYTANQPTYANYLTQLKDKNDILLVKQGQKTDLQAQLDALINVQQTRMDAGISFSDITAQIVAQQALITTKNNEIIGVQNEITVIKNNLISINNTLKLKNYFTTAEYKLLDTFIIENSYQSNNFLQTDTMTNAQIQDQSQQLFDFGSRMLARVGTPRYTFNVNSANFIFLKDFEKYTQSIQLGSYVNLEIREGYIVQPMLIEMSLNYEDENDFELVFSTRTRSDSPEFYFQDVINQSVTNGSTLNFNEYIYSDWSKNKNEVTTFINSALNAANNSIISSDKEDIIIDSHGLRARKKLDNGNYDNKQLWMSHNNLCFSDDGFVTSKLALGEITDPMGAKSFGLVAQTIVGNLIASNSLIVTNANNKFTLNASGATLIDAKFTLTSSNNKGKIILDPTSSIPIRIQGNSTGSFVDKFYVDVNGNVNFSGNLTGATGTFSGSLNAATITASTISGTSITGGNINIGGGNFVVDSYGNMTALSGSFSGNISGSTMSSSIINLIGQYGYGMRLNTAGIDMFDSNNNKHGVNIPIGASTMSIYDSGTNKITLSYGSGSAYMSFFQSVILSSASGGTVEARGVWDFSQGIATGINLDNCSGYLATTRLSGYIINDVSNNNIDTNVLTVNNTAYISALNNNWWTTGSLTMNQLSPAGHGNSITYLTGTQLSTSTFYYNTMIQGSDAILKDEIELYDIEKNGKALDIVNSTDIYQFKRIDGKDNIEIGFIAQNSPDIISNKGIFKIEELKNLTKEEKKKLLSLANKNNKNNDIPVISSINQNSVIGVLWKALQELASEIEELKKSK